PARLLFRRLVDLVVGRVFRLALLRQYLGDRGRERRLPVVDVPDRPDVAMRLVPLEFLFAHRASRRDQMSEIRCRMSGDNDNEPSPLSSALLFLSFLLSIGRHPSSVI